jgi:molybdopterin biosynthesis enzyme MoaB
MSNENEASPFHLPGKTSPTASEDDEDSNVVKENLPDSENKAENPPADKNGAAAAADNNSKRAKKRKHLTRDEKARKKNQMEIWVQGMKLCDVVLTRGGLMLKLLVP